MLRLHAPTTAQLKNLRSSVIRAQVNLGPHLLVGCDTATLEMIETHLGITRSLLATMERNLDAELHARGCCEECKEVADGWERAKEEHDRLSDLHRVLAAEREQLGRDDAGSPWHSFKVPMGSGTHPMACGAADSPVSTLAAAWTPGGEA